MGYRTTFSYDATGLRRTRAVGAATTRFIWDGQKIILETDAGGTTQAQFTLNLGTYGDLISQRRSSTSRWYHFDALGSTDRLTGSDHRTADTLYNLSACGAGFRIRNNTMNGNRRYGCMLRAGGGLVEGNVFEDTTGAGVAILDEPDWPEGPVPWGITIRGNRFVRGGTCLGYADSPQGAALSVRAVRLGFALAAGRPVHDVVIEDNEFEDCLGAAIFAGAVSGLTVRGNRIHASVEAPLLRTTGAIVIADSTGVELSGNRVDDPWEGIASAVSIMADVEPGDGGVRITDLVASLAAGSKDLEDQRAR